jgi:hypothetical protein
MATGFALCGIASNFLFVCFLPELDDLACAKMTDKKLRNELKDKASGIYNAFNAMGFFFAPLMSGLINDLRGYKYTMDVVVIIGLGVAALYFTVFIVGS